MTDLDKMNECFGRVADIAEEQTKLNQKHVKALRICHDALGTIALNKNVVDPKLIAAEAVTQMLEVLKDE
jgi:hypothetical protein